MCLLVSICIGYKMYLYPLLYPRVENCSTLDTCIHSTCIARCKRKLDTSGYTSPCYGRSNNSQQPIVIIKGHPAKIAISTGVASSEWAQKCDMRPMLWSFLQPIPNPARPRPLSFSSRNQRYHHWYDTAQTIVIIIGLHFVTRQRMM